MWQIIHFSLSNGKVIHFIARRISALSTSLVVYREVEVVVLSGRKYNFGVDQQNGNSFAILGLVKENFDVLFHT